MNSSDDTHGPQFAIFSLRQNRKETLHRAQCGQLRAHGDADDHEKLLFLIVALSLTVHRTLLLGYHTIICVCRDVVMEGRCLREMCVKRTSRVRILHGSRCSFFNFQTHNCNFSSSPSASSFFSRCQTLERIYDEGRSPNYNFIFVVAHDDCDNWPKQVESIDLVGDTCNYEHNSIELYFRCAFFWLVQYLLLRSPN